MTTDTSEKGLEDLVVAAMVGHSTPTLPQHAAGGAVPLLDANGRGGPAAFIVHE